MCVCVDLFLETVPVWMWALNLYLQRMHKNFVKHTIKIKHTKPNIQKKSTDKPNKPRRVDLLVLDVETTSAECKCLV